MSDIEIIPAILTANPSELRDFISQAEGVTKRVHIDIIDGVFADNKTIDPAALNNIEHSLLLDFHLMVNEPARWLEKCVVAGASRVIAQVEMMSSVEEYIKKAQSLGLSVGLAIDLNTSIDSIEPRLLMDTDIVLVMSVPAGFGGQEFHEGTLKKISELVRLREADQTPFKIADDGGITLNYIDDVAAKGADEVIIGNRIFEGSLEDNIAKYKRAV